MKLLMLKQPWLNLIFLDLKLKESRIWKPGSPQWHQGNKYRGDILLAASQKSNTPEEVKRIMTPGQWANFQNVRANTNFDLFGTRGVSCCIVDMFGFHGMNKEDELKSFVSFHPDLQILELRNVRKIKKFPLKGMLGLLNCPDEYLKRIEFE
jgi:hypothetical protein